MKIKETIKTFLKKNSIIILLVLFDLVDIFSYALIFSQNQKKNLNQSPQKKVFIQKDSLQNFNIKNISRISDIKGPRIDDQAATVEKVLVSSSAKKTISHSTLPTKIWIFLFLAYVALLIFNLAYNFNSAVKIQWFWELFYTLLAIAVWFAFDYQKISIWYPIFILKMGIIIYAVYLYFFNKKQI